MRHDAHPEVPERANFHGVSRSLRSLAHPVRLQVVVLLFDRQYRVAELAAYCMTSPAAMSGHLKVLKENGLIEGRRKGREIFYRLLDTIPPCLIPVLLDGFQGKTTAP